MNSERVNRGMQTMSPASQKQLSQEIGEVVLEVVRPKTRCLATHANPRTGERDLPVMQTLVRSFQQQEPTFAVALTTSGPGGEIRVGDEVTVLR